MTLQQHRELWPASCQRPAQGRGQERRTDSPAPIITGSDGVPRIVGVPIADIAGLIESGYSEAETLGILAIAGHQLTLDDIGAAAACKSALTGGLLNPSHHFEQVC